MAFRAYNNPMINSDLYYLNLNENNLQKIQEQLSSGLKLVRAADNETDMYIADYLKGEKLALDRGTQNAQKALNLLRVVDDTFGKIRDKLLKLREITVEAASTENDDSNTTTGDQRKIAQQQINNIIKEVFAMLRNIQYNGYHIFGGSDDINNGGKVLGNYYRVHTGAHKDEYVAFDTGLYSLDTRGQFELTYSINANSGAITISFGTGVYRTKVYTGIGGFTLFEVRPTGDTNNLEITIDVTNANNANSSISNVEKLISAFDKIRNYYAAIEEHFQNIVEQQQDISQQLQNTESMYRNVNYASAMAEFTKLQTVMQANVAALAQGRQISQLVLQLLR